MALIKFLSGSWRQAVLSFSILAFFTFSINLAFFLWAVTRSRSLDGLGTIYKHDCPFTKKVNSAIHLAINIISTALLSGSNYCMQCLMAPTRSQIDVAHKKGRWLDIAVPSIRNFGRSPTLNKILWVLLCISSIPLHLIYNSVVFMSTSTNEYCLDIVKSDFFQLENITLSPSYRNTPFLSAMHLAYKSGSLERLSVEQCFDRYATSFQSSNGNLLLVAPSSESEDQIDNAGLPALQSFGDAGCGDFSQPFEDWMCPQEYDSDCSSDCSDNITKYRNNINDWKPFNVHPSECYSQMSAEKCKLHFNGYLLGLVTAMNLLKGLFMLLVVLTGRKEKPILTLGDAISSFMDRPDGYTRNMCLKVKGDFRRSRNAWNAEPKEPRFTHQTKFGAVGIGEWLISIACYLISLIVCIGLFAYGTLEMSGRKNIASLVDMGIGTINSKTIADTSAEGSGARSLVANVIIANSAQVIFSVLYFMYNSMFTNMSLVTEWNSFGRTRKGVRVSSDAKGSQRESYFLQLPYRYSLPLLIVSGSVHWLISQSIFLAYVEIYAPSGNVTVMELQQNSDIISFSWSPLGVILVVAAGIVMIGSLFVTARRRLKFAGMPMAGSCSAAISAACHPSLEEPGASERPLQWGVIKMPHPGVELELSGAEHCSFSSNDVGVLLKGHVYA